MLRLLEHYVSPQGEGPNVGIMSQFVRFAGCNLKCPDWPCDTPYAIDPHLYRLEQKLVSVPKLVSRILAQAEETGAKNVVFTGGEPLIQPQQDLVNVIFDIRRNSIDYSFEIFTNGTQPIHSYLSEGVDLVVDWKLPGSGEDPDNFVRIKNLDQIDSNANSIKFTIADEADLQMASGIWTNHLMNRHLQVFAGPVWGKMDPKVIVDFIKEKKLPWRLNTQVHNYVFGAQKRGT